MEQPLRRNELDLNQPFEADAGGLNKHKEVPHIAGHIMLNETPHDGVISLNGRTESQPNNGAAFRPVTVPKGVVAPPSIEGMPDEIAENTEPQVARTEHSAWHSIDLDDQGNVIGREYGAAFQQEKLVEAGQTQTQAARMNPVAIAMQQQLPTITSTPISASGQPAEPIRSSKIPINPLYAAAGQKQHEPEQAVPPTSVPTVPTDPFPANAQPSQQSHPQPFVAPDFGQTQPLTQAVQYPQPPTSVPSAAPEQQQMSSSPMGEPAAPQPVVSQHYYAQPSAELQGAVNPSFAQPALPPVAQEPQLPAGKPTRVDPQHLLPMAKRHGRRILLSPWLWLAVGILMIIYFAPSLFGA